MLIVIGPQGTGKTSMPNVLFRGHTHPIYGENTDKDFHMKLHSALCVGLDELDSFGKKESAMLKAMITTSTDAFRAPYGRTVEVFPRRFTLYGCGNRQQFLQHDPTGYRRYPIVEISRKLDFERLEADVPQLWAEAWHLYQQGNVKYWECESASEAASGHVAPNVLEEQIMTWVRAQMRNKSGGNIKNGVLYFNMTMLVLGIGMDARDARNSHITGQISGILMGNGAVSGNSFRKEIVPGVTGRHYAIAIEE
jgi:predicted P-loop ATPase